MIEPKFYVGQHVAVCQTHPGFPVTVIPATTVLEVFPIKTGDMHRLPNGEPLRYAGPGEFMYAVAGSDLIHGENLLRPIDPDTEYQDETERAREVSL